PPTRASTPPPATRGPPPTRARSPRRTSPSGPGRSTASARDPAAARPAQTRAPRPSAVELLHDLPDRTRDRVEQRPDLRVQALVLAAALGRDRVVAAAAALGVLPLPLDQPAGLELAQQRIHRVRVDRDNAGAHLRDALHELVAVRRASVDVVEHEQREHVAPR